MALAALPVARGWYANWGSTEAECGRALPGDGLVSDPKGTYMHAVTIRASAADIWPWLAQIGQGRGGFYSYDFLENLAGCNIHSADRVIPEFQNVRVGDPVRMHPTSGYPYVVSAVEPGRFLLLEIRVDTRSGRTFSPGDPAPDAYMNYSWLFYLDEGDDGTTRLISRSRNDWNRSVANALVYGFFEPVSLVMDRKMLLGIRVRAEASARRGSDGASGDGRAFATVTDC